MAVIPDHDELWRHPHPPGPVGSSLPADATLQDVPRPELVPDLPQRLRAVAVLLGARPADHPKARQAREAAGELFGQAVGEVLIGRWAEILERQDREHRG